MKVINTAIEGICIIEPQVFEIQGAGLWKPTQKKNLQNKV